MARNGHKKGHLIVLFIFTQTIYKITFHFQKGLPLCQEMEKGNKARPLKAISFKMYLSRFPTRPTLVKMKFKILSKNCSFIFFFIVFYIGKQTINDVLWFLKILIPQSYHVRQCFLCLFRFILVTSVDQNFCRFI